MNNLAEIPAIILAGGKGTRLRSVVADRPKVLAEVCGRPYLTHLLDQLNLAGVREVVISTGYMAHMVEETIGTEYLGMTIRYSQEESALGTGGGIRLAADRIEAPVYFAMNGDSYCAANLQEYAAWFMQSPKPAALLLTKVPNTSRYGKVVVDESGNVLSFVEKGASNGPGLINAGIYLLRKNVVKTIPTGTFVSIEQEIFPALVGDGLFGFQTSANFLDIGTPESYRQAETFFKQVKEAQS